MDQYTIDLMVGGGVAFVVGALILAFVYLIMTNREQSRVIKSLQENIYRRDFANNSASDILEPYTRRFWFDKVLAKIEEGKIPSSELNHLVKFFAILYKIAPRKTWGLFKEIQQRSCSIKNCRFDYHETDRGAQITIFWDGAKGSFQYDI